MKILIVGAGAIGTYLGVSLSVAGADVSYVERNIPENFAKGIGLNVELPKKTIKQDFAKVYATLKMACDKREFDLILLAVKAYHIDFVIRDLLEYQNAFEAIACIQNGVDTEPAVKAAFPNKEVIALSLVTAVTRINRTRVRPEIIRGIVVDTNSQMGLELFKLIQKTDMKAKNTTNPTAMKWSKMVTNLFANASCAILDFSPEKIYNRIDLFMIERQQIAEVVEVMKKGEIPIIDLPGVPVNLLVYLFTKLPVRISQVLLANLLGKGRGEKMPSFHIDLSNGVTDNEVRYLNGTVARIARELGLIAPVNNALSDILMRIVRKEVDWDEFRGKPERLIAEVNAYKT